LSVNVRVDASNPNRTQVVSSATYVTNAFSLQKQQVERQETVEKTRSEYKLGVGKIADWLDNVEGLLEKEIPCDYESIKELLHGLEVCEY
jgi:hypothetical protein